MIQIVSTIHWVTHELHWTDMSLTNKGAGTYNSKMGCCMNGKKIWKSLKAKNISRENLFTSPSRIPRTMQTHRGSFGNSFSTCIGQPFQSHFKVKVETAQIHRYRQRHISLGLVQQSRIVLRHLVVKVDTSQFHKYRQPHIWLGEVQHSSKILWRIYSLFTIFP